MHNHDIAAFDANQSSATKKCPLKVEPSGIIHSSDTTDYANAPVLTVFRNRL